MRQLSQGGPERATGNHVEEPRHSDRGEQAQIRDAPVAAHRNAASIFNPLASPGDRTASYRGCGWSRMERRSRWAGAARYSIQRRDPSLGYNHVQGGFCWSALAHPTRDSGWSPKPLWLWPKAAPNKRTAPAPTNG